MKMFYLDSLEVYRFIVVYTTKHLYPPSMQEIAKEFHTSKSIAFERCKDLDLHGYVNITKGISRGITLIGYELVSTKNGRTTR